MPILTIEIPKKILRGGATGRLIVVDPKKFGKELRRKWEYADTRHAIKVARQEKRRGKLKIVADLKEIMR